ncbi:MAG TPA: hypothetical protein VMJ12_00085 [Candidatus Acidoferrales bacterium]|nr:hypothetical protein [Candidatus Acidoferrales bacterium]
MKRKHANQNGSSGPGVTTLKRACLAACGKVLGRIAGAKQMIFNESRGALREQERLLRLALNEAEAVAWQTGYPELVFPALATEKVQAVAAWDAKLQKLRRTRYAWWSAQLARNHGRHQARAGL